MQWKLNGAEPVYLQIMEHFRGAVLSGAYQPGQRVPSVRDLAAEARVNPNTMQRAMSELEKEGLLYNHGALGRFVTDDAQVLEQLRRQHRSLVVRRCARMLAEVGMTLEEAVQLYQEEV